MRYFIFLEKMFEHQTEHDKSNFRKLCMIGKISHFALKLTQFHTFLLILCAFLWHLWLNLFHCFIYFCTFTLIYIKRVNYSNNDNAHYTAKVNFTKRYMYYFFLISKKNEIILWNEKKCHETCGFLKFPCGFSFCTWKNARAERKKKGLKNIQKTFLTLCVH